MKSGRPGPGRWLFLASVVLAWGAAALWAPDRLGPALRTYLSLLGQMLPALGLVFALLFVANLFMERPWVERHMGRDAGLRGWLFALGAGLLAAGPPWPWYGFAGQLMARGVRPGLAAAFLYARAVKPPLLPLLVFYFGLAYTVTLTAWLLVLAVVVGLAVQRLLPDHRPPISASKKETP